MKQAQLILTADWHLRETIPVSRTDDFWTEQWKKVLWINELQEEHDCPVLHSGDLFHHWKPSPYLLNYTIAHLPKMFYTVYGNHDLPQHNLDERNKCGVEVLNNADLLEVLPGTHFGQIPTKSSLVIQEREILVWHVLTFKKQLPFPGCTEMSAREILRKYKKYDLIVTGDNHKTFTDTLNGRLLVNPGSITRQTAAQINHRPCVFLYYAETNTVEKVYIPISEGVISREHLEQTEKRDSRISAFISSLDTDYESDVSFKQNLKKFYAKNRVRTEVKELITKFTEV
jgi:predicted phosphodiesterase